MLLKKIVRTIIWILTILTCLYVAGTLVVDATKVHRWANNGTFDTNINRIRPGDSTLVFVRVNPLDYPTGAVPSRGDTLIKVGDNVVTNKNIGRLIPAPRPAGMKLTCLHRHNGEIVTSTIVSRPVSETAIISNIILYLLRGLIAIGFVVVGLWALYFRSDNDGARVLVLFCLAMTIYLLRAFAIVPEVYASFSLPLPWLQQGLFLILVTYLETFWLHLQLVFPHKHRFLQTKPALKYIALYFLQTISMALFYLQTPKNYIYIQLYIQLVFLIQIGTGLLILWVNYRNSQPGLERRQLKLVLLGSLIGLVPLALFLCYATIIQIVLMPISQFTQIVIINCVFAILLVTPAMYAYAMGRYRLLDVEAKLRRGTRYLIVTGLLSIIVFAIVYLISGTLLQYAKITDRTPTLIIAILFTLGVTPAQAKIQAWLEKRFYPERSNLRAMFADFVQSLGAIPDRDTLWEELKSKLKSGLLVEQVVPVLHQVETTGLQKPSEGTAPFGSGSEFLKLLHAEQKPVLIDELMCNNRIHFLPGEAGWLKEQKIVLVLPMVVHSRLIGFIGLGFKSDQQDFSPHDLTLLSSLGSQVALANENLRLREESIEKKRLEEQLAIAREIQLGFLPRSIPEVKGLSVAAKSVSCIEVAGDYYDVFDLPGDRTVLAIGDVVGKGAGAAMLMANLQASFRTAIEGDEPLNAMIHRINGHIYRNTSPEQFITFFAGIYDPVTRVFEYVNAGHNPPLLLRSNGKDEELSAGGILLGTVREPEYELGRVTLQQGDMLILYTDGVSEVMNAKEEEFGPARIIDVARNTNFGNVAETVEAIYSQAIAYHGRDQFDDDITMIAAKVI